MVRENIPTFCAKKFIPGMNQPAVKELLDILGLSDCLVSSDEGFI
jgi:hypothetical protein